MYKFYAQPALYLENVKPALERQMIYCCMNELACNLICPCSSIMNTWYTRTDADYTVRPSSLQFFKTNFHICEQVQ